MKTQIQSQHAAAAIRARAKFVTINVVDLEPLVAHGLQFVPATL